MSSVVNAAFNPGKIPVKFPVYRRGHSREAPVIYDDQTCLDVPLIRSFPYGLEPKWEFSLQGPRQLAVFIAMRPGCTADPGIAIGMVSPCHTFPAKLEVVDGFAVAMIDLDEEVDLGRREGAIILYAERTEGKAWLREPSLTYGLIYLAVSLLVSKQILRELVRAVGQGLFSAVRLRALWEILEGTPGDLLETCPECGLKLPASELWAQVAHMEVNHPEVLARRLRIAGFQRDVHGNWQDMLVGTD